MKVARIAAVVCATWVAWRSAACARRNATPQPTRMAHAHPMTLKERNQHRRSAR